MLSIRQRQALTNSEMAEAANRVFILAGEFPPFAGGISYAAAHLAEALARKGCAVTVFAPRYKDDSSGFDRQQSYRILRLPLMRLRYVRMLPMTPVLLALAAKDRPDWVIAMRVTREGLPALAIKEALGIPMLVFAHGLEFMRFHPRSLSWRFCRWLYDQADGIAAISDPTRQELLQRGVRADKINTVHLGISDQMLESVLPLSHWNGHSLTGAQVLLTVGRLVGRKGVDKVIEALPIVLRYCPNALYIVVGDGRHRAALQQLAERLGVSDRVLFTGRVSDIRPFYHTCDVFVMPAREGRKGDTEGLGLVYLEAAACGKPVIASLVGGVADAVVPNETALIVDPYDPQDIAHAIVRLLTDRELAHRLGQAGRKRVLQHFTYDRVAEKVLALMERVKGIGQGD